MKFTQEVEYLKTEIRNSKTSGNPYVLVSFLTDDGDSFSVISKVEEYPNLSRLDKVLAEFEVNLGRYMNLNLIGIEKID